MKHPGSKEIQSREKLTLGVFLFTNFMTSPREKLMIGQLLRVSRITCSYLAGELSLAVGSPGCKPEHYHSFEVSLWLVSYLNHSAC